MTKVTDKQAAAYHYFSDAMRRVEEALHGQLAKSDLVPEGWAEIAKRRGPPGKVKVTLRLDADVLAFFKTMGAGHLVRMNDVLAAYMQARIAGVVRGAEAAGGSVLAAMAAEEDAGSRLRARMDRISAGFEAERARREAAYAALSEADKRKLRLAELRAAAEARKGG